MQRRTILAASTLLPVAAQAQGFTPQNPECIAGAAPGGGFDISCRLTARMLNQTGIVGSSIRTQNMPGGIGAVAINHINAQRRADPNVIVAVSTGSWVNMATGRFGRFGENDVRWIGAIGADYGVIAVKKDSRFQTLADLVNALKADSAGVPMGAGGAVGSQDWTKAALVARAAGVDPRRMRYVPFEGGGQALAALLGGHIQMAPADASEARGQFEAGEIRLLAVLAAERLPGALASVPTAREQGFQVEWPIVRGFYGPPQMPDTAYDFWVDALRRLTAHPDWPAQRSAQGLFEFNMVGAEFTELAKRRTAEFRQLARDVGLVSQ
ncbi:tripartite tricarboxylate transporter substrate binding protein [Roseococcus sp. SYP-B2431]|uniref:Bug family tripartite tricarboxylate transporter substrate binding protein n=1 Tax=Roseococcus sp. SYP-B2431 TaxID=2496640 RepID=UPI00103C1532|nr:tripartite tricarboxylate transporter substrate-binding protein [Roseococcus sp. SYP-B2431]TCH99911.1 tripartite tricarboxylate transporter substrate binding protein [Roseococcus sp. SYP-B2431]